MRSSIFTIMIVCGAFIFGAEILAQRENPDIRERLLDYLTGYCEEGEEVPFMEFIRKNEKAVEPMIVGFVKDGVPEELIKKTEATAQKLYADRQKRLDEKDDLGLSKENLEILKKEPQEDFTKRMVKDFRDGFMKQSILGLSWLSSKDARDLLNSISTDEKHPYQRSAKYALSLLKE
jgi:hypothetical protein